MGSWSLEAFTDSESENIDVDKFARDCVATTGDFDVLFADHLCPFDNSKLGVRIEWKGWYAIVMVRNDSSVLEDSLQLSKSRCPPASTRKRLAGCNQSIRVFFGSDDSKAFTNHIIQISELLQNISSNRVYDSKQKRFW